MCSWHKASARSCRGSRLQRYAMYAEEIFSIVDVSCFGEIGIPVVFSVMCLSTSSATSQQPSPTLVRVSDNVLLRL
ncbi:hypothetical protein Csa_002175 [Cucumis sativus]|uniref:Uncharacterized protein n=1 Tax=Cucumis sativus TaxID=3659 RepID=A0A0A0L9C3_CUCSA|nr:hypothetical protein Csa_002175 [Cucumis sativus]